MLMRRARAESEKNRDQPDGIDRDKNWNEREQKFLDDGLIHVLALPIQSSTQSSLLPSTKPFHMKVLSILSLTPALALTVIVDLRAENLKTVDDFRAAAAKANAVLTIPDWEKTPEAIEAAMKNAIAKANAALDQIGAQDPGKVTFKSTVVALDDVTYEASLAANRATIIKETNTNPAMRTAAENAVKAFQDWAVGVDYREDVYKAIKAFADTHPKLTGEDEKLLKETLRDYRRE